VKEANAQRVRPCGYPSHKSPISNAVISPDNWERLQRTTTELCMGDW